MLSSISRNESVRNKVAQSRKENGFMLKFMSEQTHISTTTVSSWRTGKMQFMDEKLDRIEEFLKRYDKQEH